MYYIISKENSYYYNDLLQAFSHKISAVYTREHAVILSKELEEYGYQVELVSIHDVNGNI